MLRAIVFINAAFILYTVGVWSEKTQGSLKLWHLLLFWFGIVCDGLGTSAMGEIHRNAADSTVHSLFGFLPAYVDFHSLTGLLALALMLLHACWATVVIVNRKQDWIKKFHQYSLMVWIVWLIPFINGVIFHFR